MEWIKVSDNLPVPDSPVLVAYLDERYPPHSGAKEMVYVVVRACWIPQYYMEADCYEGDDEEYNEETDTYYWPQGWYEWNECEDTHFRLPDRVTHWMLLPAAPSL
jgi:hypothetical protein